MPYETLTFGVVDSVPYYWLGLTMVILVIFADRRIKDSRVGRAWEATREDEDAAEVMGVPTFKFKLLAFAMGAFIGGLSGGLYAAYIGFLQLALQLHQPRLHHDEFEAYVEHVMGTLIP